MATTSTRRHFMVAGVGSAFAMAGRRLIAQTESTQDVGLNDDSMLLAISQALEGLQQSAGDALTQDQLLAGDNYLKLFATYLQQDGREARIREALQAAARNGVPEQIDNRSRAERADFLRGNNIDDRFGLVTPDYLPERIRPTLMSITEVSDGISTALFTIAEADDTTCENWRDSLETVSIAIEVSCPLVALAAPTFAVITVSFCSGLRFSLWFAERKRRQRCEAV